ncbi:hypothetical protein LTR16_011952, partial [Cryomyces antarcticus]
VPRHLQRREFLLRAPPAQALLARTPRRRRHGQVVRYARTAGLQDRADDASGLSEVLGPGRGGP